MLSTTILNPTVVNNSRLPTPIAPPISGLRPAVPPSGFRPLSLLSFPNNNALLPPPPLLPYPSLLPYLWPHLFLQSTNNRSQSQLSMPLLPPPLALPQLPVNTLSIPMSIGHMHPRKKNNVKSTAPSIRAVSPLNRPPPTYNCVHCGRDCGDATRLRSHLRAHTLGCKCRLCGKTFSRHWLLQGHIRTHTGERPFRCAICSKAFADKSNLRAHTQTHSGIKPFKCARCGKAFALKSYLSKHEDASCLRRQSGKLK